jgi:hypothetical protein
MAGIRKRRDLAEYRRKCGCTLCEQRRWSDDARRSGWRSGCNLTHGLVGFERAVFRLLRAGRRDVDCGPPTGLSSPKELHMLKRMLGIAGVGLLLAMILACGMGGGDDDDDDDDDFAPAPGTVQMR